MEEQMIYEMSFHESASFLINDGDNHNNPIRRKEVTIIRVAGGWLYSVSTSFDGQSVTFVPFSAEFKK
jgi:hypothetical protein